MVALTEVQSGIAEVQGNGDRFEPLGTRVRSFGDEDHGRGLVASWSRFGPRPLVRVLSPALHEDSPTR
jgi:hypothetical protein